MSNENPKFNFSYGFTQITDKYVQKADLKLMNEEINF